MDTLAMAVDLLRRILAAEPDLDVNTLAEVRSHSTILGVPDRVLVGWDLHGGADLLPVAS